MEIAIVASLPAKGDMEIDSCHAYKKAKIRFNFWKVQKERKGIAQ